ncbi:hypothetical protein OKA05_05310 [Luteolibacter arcticus]|uniref:Peptidase M48 domain-containing protein n=1 Tax=Luteolibacter arcticus TaxID=1581411 RepID=A0ABT3GEB4_9BACT|nr:hypothetical protein [Luteolibacter arcticus]MCW1921960.1 hypothetical protein [Luteolibacter arcticus]
MRCFSRGFLMGGALLLPAMAAFVPPAEGPVPFRRDKLPVDVDTMTALSRQVIVLAAAEDGEGAGERRAVAQMAALALALDPANRQARDLIAAAAKGEKPGTSDEKELERARNRAWQTLSWLEMPEAGTDANALAACLGDVLAVADPRHPKAKEHSGEKGAWKDWVAAKEAFQTKEAVKPVEPDPESGDGGEKPVKPAETLALADLELAMPLWVQNVETGEESLQAVKVTFHGELSGKGKTEFMVAGEGVSERLAKPFRALETAMTARHGSLPSGLTVSLGFGKATYSLPRNGNALTGTTALLLEGALTGKVPTAITLAQVGEGGKLELPPKFWKSLKALAAMPGGGRVILPEQAAEFLPSLLTMDQAAFFMKREILLASTVDELCDLAAATPEGAAGDAMKRFSEIRKVGEGKALGTFAAHPATQQRLKELTDVMPKHASARMLALQGSGARARFLPRQVLAREIRTALEPAAMLANLQIKNGDDEADHGLDKAHETSRTMLDALSGYIDIRDRDLHKAALEVTDSLRTLSRLISKEEDNFGNVTPKKMQAVKTARDGYQKAIRDLTTAAGDEADYPLPKAGGDDN